jgi:hypothetical protein
MLLKEFYNQDYMPFFALKYNKKTNKQNKENHVNFPGWLV